MSDLRIGKKLKKEVGHWYSFGQRETCHAELQDLLRECEWEGLPQSLERFLIRHIRKNPPHLVIALSPVDANAYFISIGDKTDFQHNNQSIPRVLQWSSSSDAEEPADYNTCKSPATVVEWPEPPTPLLDGPEVELPLPEQNTSKARSTSQPHNVIQVKEVDLDEEEDNELNLILPQPLSTPRLTTDPTSDTESDTHSDIGDLPTPTSLFRFPTRSSYHPSLSPTTTHYDTSHTIDFQSKTPPRTHTRASSIDSWATKEADTSILHVVAERDALRRRVVELEAQLVRMKEMQKQRDRERWEELFEGR